MNPTSRLVPFDEPFCSVSTLQGVIAPEHAKAWTPNEAAQFVAAIHGSGLKLS
jgi:hypothetical protein